MSIPKIIHFCWFGGNPLPDIGARCLESWKKFCPDYQILQWNETNFDFSDCPYAREAYEAGKYAFVTDYVRLKVLYEMGGVYFDTDVELIKPLDDLMTGEGFMGFEKGYPTPYGRTYQIATGIGVAAAPHSDIIKALLDDYRDIHFIGEDGELDTTSCPSRNTRTLVNLGLKADGSEQFIGSFRFLPSDYLCPIDFVTGKKTVTERTHAVHLYSGSWIQKRKHPDWRLRFECTLPGRLLWRAKLRARALWKDRIVLYNVIRFGILKKSSKARIHTAGRILLGKNTRFLAGKKSEVFLGKNLASDGRCTIIAGEKARLRIGEDVYFDENVMISCLKSVSIGSGSIFGPNVKIFDNNYQYSASKGVLQEHASASVFIGEGCWISSNVTILKGAVIGRHCIIGEGCIISGSVPDYSRVTLLQQTQTVSIDDITL